MNITLTKDEVLKLEGEELDKAVLEVVIGACVHDFDAVDILTYKQIGQNIASFTQNAYFDLNYVMWFRCKKCGHIQPVVGVVPRESVQVLTDYHKNLNACIELLERQRDKYGFSYSFGHDDPITRWAKYRDQEYSCTIQGGKILYDNAYCKCTLVGHTLEEAILRSLIWAVYLTKEDEEQETKDE